jgi:hypothetical protein
MIIILTFTLNSTIFLRLDALWWLMSTVGMLIYQMEGRFCYMMLFLLTEFKQILSYSSFNGAYCKVCVNLVELFVITVT